MECEQVTCSRKVVMRIYGEEIRRFHTDIVVEAPAGVTDEQLEKMWPRQFDGVRDGVEWTFDCSTGIWPSNCGRRIKPEVRRDAAEDAVAQVCLDRSPKGSLVVKVQTAVDVKAR